MPHFALLVPTGSNLRKSLAGAAKSNKKYQKLTASRLEDHRIVFEMNTAFEKHTKKPPKRRIYTTAQSRRLVDPEVHRCGVCSEVFQTACRN